MKPVVIFGAGAIARMASYELVSGSGCDVAAFTVDREYQQSAMVLGRPVIAFEEVDSVYPPDRFDMLVAVGYLKMNQLRADRCALARELGYTLISYVSPRAITWGDLRVGENTFIAPGALVEPSAAIGADVYIGSYCVISHDCVVEDHCFFSDSVTLAGGVTVGARSFMGTGAIVRNHVTVARECVIGAGAVVLSDTDERGVYMGQAAECLPVTSDKLNLA